VFSVTLFTVLLGNVFQRRTFPFLWVPNLSPASATSCSSQLTVLLQTLSRLSPRLLTRTLLRLTDSLLMAAGLRYIASVRTAQKTPFPTVLILLRACLLRPSHKGYWASSLQQACLRSRSLATAVSAGFTILAFNRHATILSICLSIYLSIHV
jgi:hypothetical protein